jgi:hypothetical protein
MDDTTTKAGSTHAPQSPPLTMSAGSHGTDGSSRKSTPRGGRRPSYLDSLLKQQSEALGLALSTDDYESQQGEIQPPIELVQEEGGETVGVIGTASSKTLASGVVADSTPSRQSTSTARHQHQQQQQQQQHGDVNPRWVKRVSVAVKNSKLVEGK